MSDTVIVPGTGTDGFVELARTQKGRLFKKQILHMNESFVHPNIPGKKIKVDENLALSLKKNFDAGYCDIVQIPIVDGANKHNEDPLRNVGQVIDIEYDNKGVYAILDARDPDHANKLGKTLIGASAMMHLDYTDTKTGKTVGPTLLHVGVTNRPYITNLEDFEELVKLSADTSSDAPALLKAAADIQEEHMDKDAMIAALKSEHGIDVAALTEAAGRADTSALTAALSNVLKEAGVVSLSNTDEDLIGIKDIAEAVVELSGEKVKLEKTVAALAKQADEVKLSGCVKEVEAYIKEGRVLPKQKEAMIALAMEDRETFELLLPDQPLVSLSAEGVTVHEESESSKFEDETQRLIELAAAHATGKKS